MSGLIGGILRRHLEEVGGYELRALNRRPVEGVPSIQADISDLDAIRPAFDGIDTVVHLAAYLGGTNDWEGNLAGNIVGAYNVYEASRQAGVRRVVSASSGATIRGYESVHPYSAMAEGRYEEVPDKVRTITHHDTWPDGIYGAAKVWGEAIGRNFSDRYALSLLCVRIGRVNDEDRPTSTPEMSRYLSHRDVTQMLRRCIEAPDDLKYDIFLATSRNRWGYRDLEHARQVLGYEPQDSAEDFPLP
jgi:nucleoside-diphosphate-sugar epimerase